MSKPRRNLNWNKIAILSWVALMVIGGLFHRQLSQMFATGPVTTVEFSETTKYCFVSINGSPAPVGKGATVFIPFDGKSISVQVLAPYRRSEIRFVPEHAGEKWIVDVPTNSATRVKSEVLRVNK